MDGKTLLCKKHFATGEAFPPAVQVTFIGVQSLPRVRLALLA